MPVKITSGRGKVISALAGEIDHHSAQKIRNEIDVSISETLPVILEMDFSGVSFMDSSGIGLVMGRYKIMNSRGGKVIIRNPSPEIKKVMLLSGLDRLVTITNSIGK